MHLSDSQVAIGVMAKGRSSSRKLASQVRRLGGLLLGGHLYMGVGWTKTDENPADRPSRRWRMVTVMRKGKQERRVRRVNRGGAFAK